MPPTSTIVSSILTLVSLALAPPIVADSWTSYRGPAGTGRAADSLPPGEAPLELSLAWKQSLGSGYSGLAVAGGRVVTAAVAGERDVVVALDTATGDEIWRYDLAPTYPGHDGSHDGPISTPAVAGGRVFMLGPWGHFAALDLASGTPLWTTHLADDHGVVAPYYGFGSSPVVVDDLVLLQVGGSEGAVAAFDVATGLLRWRAFPDEGEAGSQSPIVAELAGRRQVLALGAHKVAGFDPADGALLWELALEGEPGAMGAMTQSPVPIDGNRLLIKHRDDEALVIAVTESDGGLAAAVTATGSGMARSYSPPTAADGRLYGYSARMLSAVDPDDAELLWRSRDPGDGFLVSVGDQLAVITKTGRLHLGKASADGWLSASRIELFDELAWTPPSFADGALYVRSLGAIARVDLVRGEPAPTAEAGREDLPAALRGLAERLGGADDEEALIEAFLGDRELPLIDGREVVFLWHGAADDVAIGGDMIGMRREEPMRRLADTDLWWWATELDRHARMSYLFFVDDQPATDPSHDRRVASTVLGPDMNWFRGESVEMSWFAMPDWPGLAHAAAEGTSAGGARGRVETLEIALQPPKPDEDKAPEPVSVTVRVWLPPGYDEGSERYPAVYVRHPGAHEAGAWPKTLDRVVGRTVTPLIAVFPDPPRMRGYGDLFAEQLVPQIEARYRTRPERDARAMVGMGWPAFSASMITFEHPELFGRLGLQSLFLLEEETASLRDAVGSADATSLPLAIYLEWGRWDLTSPHEEMNMRQSSRWAWEFFREKGWQPIGGEVWDSTDFASWRNRTAALLESLFPLNGPGDSLAVWLTDAPELSEPVAD
jgi:outer membrane protein assembly factor BamB